MLIAYVCYCVVLQAATTRALAAEAHRLRLQRMLHDVCIERDTAQQLAEERHRLLFSTRTATATEAGRSAAQQQSSSSSSGNEAVYSSTHNGGRADSAGH
jgi:hypothetical protein